MTVIDLSRRRGVGALPRAVLAVLVAAGMATTAASTSAQIREQIVLTSHQASNSHPHIRRYDRRLKLLGQTDLVPEAQSSINEVLTEIGIAPDGTIWIPIDPLNQKKLVRLDRDGNLLPSVVLGHNPVCLTVAQSGQVYALTRIPLQIDGPLYGVSSSGNILWSNGAAPALYGSTVPAYLAVTTLGEVWVGSCTDLPCGACGVETEGLLVQIDPATGGVVRTLILDPDPQELLTAFADMAGAPDGSVWSAVGYNLPFHLMKTDTTGVLASVPVPTVSNGVTLYIRVDAAGDIWWVSPNSEPTKGSLVWRFSQTDGSVLEEYDTGGIVVGFALGPTGEEVFAVANSKTVVGQRRLVRIQRVTGRMSSIPLDPPYKSSGLGGGDPTGFVFANVVDQDGDNDGDGATNRQETLAGSSPYDPLSRPEGPKVYVNFAQSNNAIILKFVDPDGLLNPAGGLDLSTLSVKLGPYGEVFNYLLPFLTFVQVSPDLTSATAFFGALPLASDKKWELEASVADKTGAVGWDWQVTPPGEL